jgi:hypothetical protein
VGGMKRLLTPSLAGKKTYVFKSFFKKKVTFCFSLFGKKYVFATSWGRVWTHGNANIKFQKLVISVMAILPLMRIHSLFI